MKKLALICLLTTIFLSCSIDNGPSENFHFEILPIATVSVPDYLVPNDVNRITYTYYTPSTCHGFNDLYYIENGNQRTIAVVNIVTDTYGAGLACESLENVIDERGFDFIANPYLSSYVFNFWQGEDENGEDIYLTIEIPVNQ